MLRAVVGKRVDALVGPANARGPTSAPRSAVPDQDRGDAAGPFGRGWGSGFGHAATSSLNPSQSVLGPQISHTWKDHSG